MLTVKVFGRTAEGSRVEDCQWVRGGGGQGSRIAEGPGVEGSTVPSGRGVDDHRGLKAKC